MAPHGESLSGFHTYKPNSLTKPPRLSTDGLKRTLSDMSFDFMRIKEVNVAENAISLQPISEVEDTECECCGMIEECTPEYIHKIQNNFSGKWICGLCAEAVKEEMTKNGGHGDEALSTHMSACVSFNKLGRAYPVLCQAEAMRDLLKKSMLRSKSLSPTEKGLPKKGGTIARSSSCMSAINRTMIN